MKLNESSVEEYLVGRGIKYTKSGKELITRCLFRGCDGDSQGKEAHLYFSAETGQYECKKCGEKGNLITLKRFLGDLSNNADRMDSGPKKNVRRLTPTMVEKYHASLPTRIIDYLHERGLTDGVINEYKLGYGIFYGSWWITIPIKDIDGNYSFLKLREDPQYGKKKMTWPSGIDAQIYDWDALLMAKEGILIAEGEMDALLMKSKGVPCVTNTHGANTVKKEWMEHFRSEIKYCICYDNDEAGRIGSQKMANELFKNGCKNIHIINLPLEVGEKGDLGDYVVRLGLPIEDLFSKYAKPYPEKIDTSKFKEISIHDVCNILNSTIKKDDENKSITFLSMIVTYTDESQMNIFFNAPSSTGKSHIPLSVVELFPKEDTIILANCSPTAFFHEQGAFDKEKNEIVVDLSRKILIFTDMPNTGLVERLRSLLSHDAKESRSKITDKNQKGGNRTKTVVLIGYPSVYFCSAGLKVDEQESTRFIMLSPSIEHDKLVQGIKQSISKETDREKFLQIINSDPDRMLLKNRILAIRQENISDVRIENPELVEKLFLKDTKSLKPRQQRDVKKVISLIKGLALLNLWFRKRERDYVVASKEDINNAFGLWNRVSYGQDYGLPPYVFSIYTQIIVPLWNEQSKEFGPYSTEADKKRFVTRKEILNKHFEIYGRPLSPIYLRQHILPQLEQTGLLVQEKHPDNHREMVVVPLDTDTDVEKAEEVVKTDNIVF